MKTTSFLNFRSTGLVLIPIFQMKWNEIFSLIWSVTLDFIFDFKQMLCVLIE